MTNLDNKSKYYLYCPKCGKKKNRLPRWKALQLVNISKEKLEYEYRGNN